VFAVNIDSESMFDVQVLTIFFVFQLVAPEAELLPMSYMISSQNAYYSLIGNGLNACDGGVGPYFSRG